MPKKKFRFIGTLEQSLKAHFLGYLFIFFYLTVINANAAVTLLEQRPEKNFRL